MVVLFLALARGAEPLPDACPGPVWGTISRIRYRALGIDHVAPADNDSERAGVSVVEVVRTEYNQDVTRIGRVGSPLCGDDRLETWHGVSVDITLHDQGAITRLPDGARLWLRTDGVVVVPWLLEGIAEWYAMGKLTWTPFQTADLRAVSSRSSFRVEVDKTSVQEDACACAPTVRVAVLEKDPDGSGDHAITVEHRRSEHEIPGGEAWEFRPGSKAQRLPETERARMLGALGQSAAELRDALERAQGMLRPVAYPLVQLQVEKPVDHTPYRLEVGQVEVSNATWAEVMGSRHEPPPGCIPASEDPAMPLGCVTWDDAVLFANHLSRRNGYHPVYRPMVSQGWAVDRSADGYRLPEWSEWRQLLQADPSRLQGPNQCSANLAGQESALPLGLLDVLTCSDPWAGPAPVAEVFGNGDRLRGLVGNMWELLSCPNDLVCQVAGGSWRTGRTDLPDLSITPLRLGTEEARPDVGLRLVREVPVP